MSADYPGVVRKALRDRLGSDLPIVFLLGFAGDVRPNRIVSLPMSPYYFLRRMVNGPVFRRFTRRSWSRWTASLSGVAVAAASDGPHLLAVSRIASSRRTEPLCNLMLGEADDRPLTFQYVQLGDRCVIFGISAETVIEYADELKTLFPDRIVVPVGCLDGTCGYLPTSAMLGEGGTEVESPGYSLTRDGSRRTSPRR